MRFYFLKEKSTLIIISFFVLLLHITVAFKWVRIKMQPTFNIQPSSSKNSESSELNYSFEKLKSSQPTIEVFSTLGCKYCRRAKAILNELDIPFSTIDIERESALEVNGSIILQERIAHAKKNTVPQIYVASWHIGGCSELEAEIESKEFFLKLEAIGVKYNENYPSSRTPLTITTDSASLTSLAAKHLDLFLNNEGIDFSGEFFEDIFAISTQLQRISLSLTDKFSTTDGRGINYRSMRMSTDFKEYVIIASKLRKVRLADIAKLLEKSRLAFFGNLYNSLILHATCVIGPPADSPDARSQFFSGSSGAIYNIGGYLFSPDDIEHGVLRANTRHPYQKNDNTNFFPNDDPRSQVSLTTLDPRIHFILNCGAKSCPAIKILPEDPEEGLSVSTASYLKEELSIDSESKTIYLPKLIHWYQKDFGSNINEMIVKLIGFLQTSEIKTKISTEFDFLISTPIGSYPKNVEDCYKIVYNEYDWSSNSISNVY